MIMLIASVHRLFFTTRYHPLPRDQTFDKEIASTESYLLDIVYEPAVIDRMTDASIYIDSLDSVASSFYEFASRPFNRFSS
jgi:hypothetical protein